nr:unnamed protein product [Callosobruchus chinensis]CAI5820697.1 unnamed protein product [Callosobruchus analis]CAI5821930.1 unnamed protein product [Callosobruchus analis]CAI5822741.1 unnamed protein product [Callosobruchus analis]CAI5825271.1 unnamed protein product [Callosobruchus analis]
MKPNSNLMELSIGTIVFTGVKKILTLQLKKL